MRTVDIHAHISPEGMVKAMAEGRDWHGISSAEMLPIHEYTPRTMWTLEQHLREMDELGVDVHVLSTNSFFYFYEREASTTSAMNVASDPSLIRSAVSGLAALFKRSMTLTLSFKLAPYMQPYRAETKG